jgi:hypothetical protein
MSDTLSDRFVWKGLNLHGKGKLVAVVEPDPVYPGMFRFRLPGGGLSDMVNLTRAKDAALAAAVRAHLRPSICPPGAAHIEENEPRLPYPTPAAAIAVGRFGLRWPAGRIGDEHGK